MLIEQEELATCIFGDENTVLKRNDTRLLREY